MNSRYAIALEIAKTTIRHYPDGWFLDGAAQAAAQAAEKAKNKDEIMAAMKETLLRMQSGMDQRSE